MASYFLSVLFLFSLFASAAFSVKIPVKKKFIVYLGEQPHPSVDAVGHHHRLLSDVLGSHEAAKESIFHSYTLSMNAFAANLTEEEADRLAGLDGVISVFPSRIRKLHTTRTWDFIGLAETAPHNHAAESDVIVAVLDTGVDPFSASFNDTGFGPPPAKWRGKCAVGKDFKCNNKLIGARWFRLDGKSPKKDMLGPGDLKGHGTHVASTVAGNAIPNANLYGMANGTARSAAPSARIATYKVCYADDNCNDEDVLAGFDAAIADGVDVINLSVGEDPGKSFTDALAVGAYHAMRRGILTVASAGNMGPMHRTIVNYSPWMLTVGASTHDRQIGTDLVLGNGKRITGVSVNTFESFAKFVPLIRGVEAGTLGMTYSAQMCGPESMDKTKIEGKIVICKIIGSSAHADGTVSGFGGVGMIIQMTQTMDQADAFNIPATMISKEGGEVLMQYMKSLGSRGTPVAKIEKSHAYGIEGIYIPSFSGRGPNPVYTEILKPDLVAPGMNIIAAYPEYLPFGEDWKDPRRSAFQIMSGTSMATPHVTSAAAYVKSFHPGWSPACLKSALMTTARPVLPFIPPNTTAAKYNARDLEYSYGSGQVDPLSAVDPGLVYNISESSYLQFLCTKHPNTTAVAILTGSRAFDCAPLASAQGYDGLNYPSFHFVVPDSRAASYATYRRVATNVGKGPAVYKAIVEAPLGVQIEVKPTVLRFERENDEREFELLLKVDAILERQPYIVSGSLTWTDGVHRVRSPVAVHYT